MVGGGDGTLAGPKLTGRVRWSNYETTAHDKVCSLDVNDAEQLSQDPPFRLIGSEKISERGAALTSRLQSFETEVLAEDENLAGLEGF